MVLLLLSIVVIIALDRVGLIDPAWLDTSVRIAQAVRVMLVVSVVWLGAGPLARMLARRYHGNWQWLVVNRWRLLFWYGSIEAVLLWGTF